MLYNSCKARAVYHFTAPLDCLNGLWNSKKEKKKSLGVILNLLFFTWTVELSVKAGNEKSDSMT